LDGPSDSEAGITCTKIRSWHKSMSTDRTQLTAIDMELRTISIWTTINIETLFHCTVQRSCTAHTTLKWTPTSKI